MLKNPFASAVTATASATGTVPMNSPTLGVVGARMAAVRKTTYAMGAIAGTMLFGAVGLIYFLNQDIRNEKLLDATKAAQVTTAEQVANQYDSTLSNYNSTLGQMRFLEKPGAQNAFIPTLLPQIQKLAQSYGCEVSSMTPGVLASPGAAPGATPAASAGDSKAAAPALSSYQTMTLSITLNGNYSSVMRFIYNLTRFPKIVTVKSLALHPGSSSNTSSPAQAASPSAVQGNLILQAYVYPPDPKADTDPGADQSSSPGSPSTSSVSHAAVVVPTPLASKASTRADVSAPPSVNTKADFIGPVAPPVESSTSLKGEAAGEAPLPARSYKKSTSVARPAQPAAAGTAITIGG